MVNHYQYCQNDAHQAYSLAMNRKKHKRTDQRSRRVSEKNSRGSSGHANRNLLIGGVAAIVVVAGLIMLAMVNNQASPTATNVSAGNGSTPQDEPKFTITPNPPTTTGAAQSGGPQFTITVGSPPATPILEGTAAPDFTLHDLKGRPVQLSKLRGKVVAVNFWATWCGPCRIEMPGLVKVYDKYREKGLEIVGVSLDQAGSQVVQEFVDKNGIKFPVALDTAQVAQRYGGVTGIPTTFVIDRQGRVAKKQVGLVDETWFENTITPLL
jgi:peroxiredoxin